MARVKIVCDTSRLILRQFTRDDLDPLAAMHLDMEVGRFIGVKTVEQTREALEQWLAQYERYGFSKWAVVRNNQVHKSSFTGAVILDGKWLELTERNVEPATGYVAKYLIGYDPQQKRFVEFDANNFGAATYSSADGWQNHALTMTSPVSPDAKPYAANRFLYSTTGPDTFTVDWQISKTAASDWIPSDHLACKRQPQK
jgi:hypothetical protein